MTKDASFKRQVRARMAATGEKYTEARRSLGTLTPQSLSRQGLFDQVSRTDSSPATSGEDNFSFLNRADGIVWERIRSVLDEWFAVYPAAHAADLRARFRSDLPGQHYAAWWELYLHRFFSHLGYEIDVHPVVPDSSRQPDFLLQRGDNDRLYVEAAVVFSGIVDESRNGAREGWIIDAANRATNSDFMVSIEFAQVGTNRPKDRAIYRPLETWLARLDPDDVDEAYRASRELPDLMVEVADWRIRFEAIPLKPEARGERPVGRIVGIGPVSAGFIDDKEQLRDALKHKSGRYGSPDIPLVVAVNCVGSFPHDEDIAAALYGSIAVQYRVNEPGTARSVRMRDGTWMAEGGPRRRRMSAVLAAVQLHSHTVLKHPPQLWLNPWADLPLTVDWPLTTWKCSESGEVSSETREPALARIFDLPPEWPGPESPW